MGNFYKTNLWKKKRAVVMRRDGYECQQCRRYGKTAAAVTVHHIYPLKDYPEYKLNSHNLISLCNDCHGQMHNRLTDELTAKGLEWVDRVKDRVEGMTL